MRCEFFGYADKNCRNFNELAVRLEDIIALTDRMGRDHGCRPEDDDIATVLYGGFDPSSLAEVYQQGTPVTDVYSLKEYIETRIQRERSFVRIRPTKMDIDTFQQAQHHTQYNTFGNCAHNQHPQQYSSQEQQQWNDWREDSGGQGNHLDAVNKGNGKGRNAAGEIICYICNGSCHLARLCPTPNGPVLKIKCPICGGNGHDKDTCTSKGGANYKEPTPKGAGNTGKHNLYPKGGGKNRGGKGWNNRKGLSGFDDSTQQETQQWERFQNLASKSATTRSATSSATA